MAPITSRFGSAGTGAMLKRARRVCARTALHKITPVTERIRVLHVLEALEGGTSRHLIDVVANVEGFDHEVVLPPRRIGGVNDESAIARLSESGATVHLLPMRRFPLAAGNAVALARLARLIRARRPTIVHGHSSIGGVLARVATPRRVPVVYTPNGIAQARMGVLAERALSRRTSRFVAVSETEAARALELGLADAERLVLIPNGVELTEPPVIDLRGRLGLPGDAPLVGMLGRLVPQKAPEDFVAACALVASEVPGARFVLIGDGALAGAVDGAVGAAGLAERFTRIEYLEGAAGALGSLDIFALSSRFEGAPFSPLEAMRAGTPVVLTDVVGNHDAIEDRVSGVLVPPGDPAAMAAAIVELLRDETLRSRIVAAGRERVRTRFDVRAMGERLAELYRGLAAI
jgi:glycosyltransferase involved in cell wall biosynthesis